MSGSGGGGGGGAAAKGDEGAGRVLVFARSRPFLGREDGDLQAVGMEDENNKVVVSMAPDAMSCLHAKDQVVMERTEKSFNFDGAFNESAGQKEVFQRVGLPVLVEVMKGFNGCIFAYGQTGSGKTHSLLNTEVSDMEQVGVLPRLVATLFARAAMDRKFVYQIKCAGFQVYNEQVDDLLHPECKQGKGTNLSISKGGAVGGLTWSECKTPASMMAAFKRARMQLHYAETKMNKSSSRSHAVFQVRIVRRQRAQKSADGTAESGAQGGRMQATMGQLSVVDLAGSERVKRSGVTGSNFKEATNINGSLLALGNVIQALADKRTHVPFRDSKLTRILEGSVGGNCKTSLLVCVSPAESSTSETLSTLEFASRAMRVEVDAKVNETVVELDADLLAAEMEDEQDGAAYVDEEMLKTFKDSEAALAAAKERAAEQEQAHAALQAKVGEMSRDVEEKDKTVAAMLKEGKKHMSEIERLKSTLQADAAAHAKEVEASKRAQGMLHEHVARAEKEVAQTKASLKSLTQQHAVEQQARAAAEQKVAALEAQAKAAEEKAAAELAESRTASQEVRAQLTAASEAHAAEAKQLRDQVEQEQSKAAELGSKVTALDGQKAELTAELGQLKNQLSSTRGLLSQENLKVEKLSEIQEEAKALREELSGARATEAELKATVSGLEADQNALNQTLAALTETYDAVKAQFESESVLRQSLEADKSALEADKAALEGSLAAEQAALEKSKARMAEAEQEHASAVEGLHAEHAENVAGVRAEAAAAMEKQARHASEAMQALETRAREDHEKLTDKVRSVEAAKAAAADAHQAKVQSIIEQHKQALQAALDAERGVHEKECEQFKAQIDAAVAAAVDTEKRAAEQAAKQAIDNETKMQHARAAAAAARAAMAKEHERLQGEHKHLAARFAARESRKEDLKLIAAQQKDINDMKHTVKNIKRSMKQKQMELEHVIDNVRIFGTQYDKPGGHLQGKVLPGQRVNEHGSFMQRKAGTPVAGAGLEKRILPAKQGSFNDPIYNPVTGASRPNTAAGLLPTRRTETPTPSNGGDCAAPLDSPAPRLSTSSQRRGRPLPTPPSVT